MIAMLRGTIWGIESDKIILDVNGVGYLLSAAAGCIKQSRVGEEKVFHTHLIVREDDVTLYGFNNPDEKGLFIMLLGVSGIGPKAALSILSTFSVVQVKSAILKEDFSLLTEVPGIGGKTAKRLILELKEKVNNISIESGLQEVITTPPNITNEALDTLLALGFSRNEARDTLNKVSGESLSTEDQIKEALRLLAKENR